jgi:ribosome-associated translation inhibitor RaiA
MRREPQWSVLRRSKQTPMTIQFQMQELEAENQLRQQVEADLQEINRMMAVASAHVTLRWQREIAPPCQVAVTLTMPGPDIHAAARDYTWPAAWRKVLMRLREQVLERRLRQASRRKGESRDNHPASPRAGLKTSGNKRKKPGDGLQQPRIK